MKSFPWLNLALVIIGTYATYAGATKLHRNYQLIVGGTSTEAVVVDVDAFNRVGHGDKLYPVFEFRAKERTYTVRNSEAYKRPLNISVGDEVSIRYDPSSPQSAVISSPWSLILSPALQTIVGIGCLVILGVQILGRLKTQAESPCE